MYIYIYYVYILYIERESMCIYVNICLNMIKYDQTILSIPKWDRTKLKWHTQHSMATCTGHQNHPSLHVQVAGPENISLTSHAHPWNITKYAYEISYNMLVYLHMFIYIGYYIIGYFTCWYIHETDHIHITNITFIITYHHWKITFITFPSCPTDIIKQQSQ